MLNNILKAIDEKAGKEIAKIAQEKERALAVLEQESAQELAQKKSQALELFKEKIEAELAEFKQQEDLAVRFAIQRKKKEIIEKAFEIAERNITNLTSEEFNRIIKALLASLGQEKLKQGEISAGPKTAQALKQLASQGLSLKGQLDREGFIFTTEGLEIDLTLRQVLSQNQEKTVPKVVEILFG